MDFSGSPVGTGPRNHSSWKCGQKPRTDLVASLGWSTAYLLHLSTFLYDFTVHSHPVPTFL